MDPKTATIEEHSVRLYDAVPIQTGDPVGIQSKKTMTVFESLRFWSVLEIIILLRKTYTNAVIVKSLFRKMKEHPRFAEFASALILTGYLALVTALAAMFGKP